MAMAKQSPEFAAGGSGGDATKEFTALCVISRVCLLVVLVGCAYSRVCLVECDYSRVCL